MHSTAADLARSLISTAESSDTLSLCLADFDDALQRCETDAEREAVTIRTIRLYNRPSEEDYSLDYAPPRHRHHGQAVSISESIGFTPGPSLIIVPDPPKPCKRRQRGGKARRRANRTL